MNIYYLQLLVKPTLSNEKFNEIQGAYANCWIKELSIEAAHSKAIFYIKKYDWKIEGIEIAPKSVTREDFNDEMGIANYDKAQEEGMAFIYVSWSRDGKSSFGPIKLKSSLKFDLEKYLSQMKKNLNTGKCLHYDSGIRCNKISKAHSIQERQMLSSIQSDGLVFTINNNFSSLKKNKGKFSYKKTGIGVFSTFRGFCQKHDNELFKSIDTQPLIPTDQQVFLYAYRSLCKELYNKENALAVYEHHLEIGTNLGSINELLKGMELGTRFGFENLKLHKMYYDESLKVERFEDIRYVLFTSDQAPNIAFSGGIFPDFDFLGRQLQDLNNHSSFLEMITFCSAPFNSGWGFLFAWHKSSSKICDEYIKSLATAVYNKSAAADFLFRLAIQSENHAFSPEWWNGLSSEKKNKIIEKTSESISVFSDIPQSYLIKGVEGISGWKFNDVLQNY